MNNHDTYCIFPFSSCRKKVSDLSEENKHLKEKIEMLNHQLKMSMEDDFIDYNDLYQTDAQLRKAANHFEMLANHRCSRIQELEKENTKLRSELESVSLRKYNCNRCKDTRAIEKVEANPSGILGRTIKNCPDCAAKAEPENSLKYICDTCNDTKKVIDMESTIKRYCAKPIFKDCPDCAAKPKCSMCNDNKRFTVFSNPIKEVDCPECVSKYIFEVNGNIEVENGTIKVTGDMELKDKAECQKCAELSSDLRQAKKLISVLEETNKNLTEKNEESEGLKELQRHTQELFEEVVAQRDKLQDENIRLREQIKTLESNFEVVNQSAQDLSCQKIKLLGINKRLRELNNNLMPQSKPNEECSLCKGLKKVECTTRRCLDPVWRYAVPHHYYSATVDCPLCSVSRDA